MSTFLDRAIAVGILVTVVFTALALGAVEAWSVAIFELITVILMLLWATKTIIDRRLTIRIPPATWPVAALVAIGLVQSIGFTDAAGNMHSLSMDVEATRGAVIVIFFLLSLFVMAANFFNSAERLRALASFLVVYGLALALFALVQHLTWEGRLFWLRATEAAGAGTGGPFVNRNHFA